MEQSRPEIGAIPEITPSELADRMGREDSIVLIDVREPHEREIADLPDWGQLRIPVGQILERLPELEREKPVVLYCRSGSRSGWATAQLASRGFDNVANLKGGLLAWKVDVDPSIRSY